MSDFIVTTALKKLSRLTKRVKVIPGGTSAGKTYNILPILINQAITTPGLEVSVVSESVPHLKKGAIKDFLKIMRATGRYIDDHYNKTDRIYTFANGSYIEFFSADQEDKVRGPRRHVLYINECNNINFETFHQLSIRTSMSIWLDFNPSEEFWAYKECKPDDDTEWLTLTYKDNEGLPESIKKEIEKALEKGYHDPNGSLEDENNIKNAYWANWWKVYGLGKPGRLDGVIYSNWSIVKGVPEGAKLLGIGLDWGWSNVNAAVELYEYGDKYVVNQILYEAGLTNAQIAERLPKGVPIAADTAEPKSIAEFRNLGHNMVEFKKGNIAYGIQFVQQHDVLVTEESVDLIKELRMYRWDEDKFGNPLGVPVMKHDHCFVGDTLVTTLNGDKPIRDVREGDMVLTSKGYRPVLHKWDNGLKEVKRYRMLFDMDSVYLECTPDHLIYTDKGWIQISELKPGMTVIRDRHTGEKFINCTQKKDTFHGVRSVCTSRYGKQRTGRKYRKGIMSTTLTGIRTITAPRTSVSSKDRNIYRSTQKSGSRQTGNSLRPCGKKVLRVPRNGMPVKKGYAGTGSMRSNTVLGHLTYRKKAVINAGLFLNPKTTTNGSARINVNPHTGGLPVWTTRVESVKTAEKVLKQISTQKYGLADGRVERVYDLTVADTHEYFANGILVHNCMDAKRYAFLAFVGQKKRKAEFGW